MTAKDNYSVIRQNACFNYLSYPFVLVEKYGELGWICKPCNGGTLRLFSESEIIRLMGLIDPEKEI